MPILKSAEDKCFEVLIHSLLTNNLLVKACALIKKNNINIKSEPHNSFVKAQV